MARVVVFRPQAEGDAVAVHAWYESRRVGLGREFGQAVEAIVARIADNPLLFQRVHGETRRAVLSQVPYAIYFRPTAEARSLCREISALKAMTNSRALRAQLVQLQGWSDAHAAFDRAVADIPAQKRGMVTKGLQYSAWQLVEHIRLAQADILEFCIGKDYQEKAWPADYWPTRTKPPSHRAWTSSLAGYRRDRKQLERLIMNPRRKLLAKVPAGTGQTYLREYLLVADHTAYHVGQLVMLRRLLGCWRAA